MRAAITLLVATATAATALLFPTQAFAQARSVYFRAALATAVESAAREAPPRRTPDGNQERVETDPVVAKVLAFVRQPFAVGAVPPTAEELDQAYRTATGWGRAGSDGAGSTFSLGSMVSGGAGLPSEATLILGLADFMVERARDEMVLTFLMELKTHTSADLFLQNAMPSSYNVLQRVDAMSVQSMLPAFRYAVTEDLGSLPARMGETTVLNAMGIGDNARTALQATSLVYTRVRDIRGGTDPMVALGNLRDLDGRRMAEERVQAPLRLLGLVATDYRFYQDSLQEFVRDHEKRRVYAGFLLHDLLPHVTGPRQQALRDMIQEQQQEIEVLAQELRSLRDAVSRARTLSLDTSAVRTVIATTLHVVRMGDRFVPQDWRTAMPSDGFIDDALEVHEALRQKNYPAVVAWLGEAAHTHFRAHPSTNTMRYLSFASTLASARTEKEVTAALRTVAAPVASYRLKRTQPNGPRRPVVVSLNGYAGGGFGMEWTESTEEGEGSRGTQFGAALPVGLEISMGMSRGGSIGIYIPVADLGTVTSQRFGGDEDASGDPELGFQQILAPGAYIVWGPWSDKPITLGVGVQSVGRLREATQQEGLLDVWRAGMFLGVDLLLLRF